MFRTPAKHIVLRNLYFLQPHTTNLRKFTNIVDYPEGFLFRLRIIIFSTNSVGRIERERGGGGEEQTKTATNI